MKVAYRNEPVPKGAVPLVVVAFGAIAMFAVLATLFIAEVLK